MRTQRTTLPIFLFAILVLGLFFRFFNVNWDDGHHLHPDERFLSMVGNDMTLPRNFSEYLDPTQSLYNPRNIGYDFFVYGSFPVTLNTLLATVVQNKTYDLITLQGRALSAFFDFLTLVFVIKLAELFQKKYHLPKNFMYWSGLFYAGAVLPIQLSHFFAVDTLVNFFAFASFYFAFTHQSGKKATPKNRYKNWNILFSAIFMGLALASKINALFILPLNTFFLFLSIMDKPWRKQLWSFSKIMILYGLITYATLRIADPNLFATRSLWNPSISPQFIENIHTLKSWEKPGVWFPPAIQWIHTQPVLFAAKNLAVFGIGLPSTALLIIGSLIFCSKISFSKNISHKQRTALREIGAIFVWSLALFMYQSTQFVKALRYFIFLYPFLALLVGYSVTLTFQLIESKITTSRINRFSLTGFFSLILLLWPLMFLSIYIQPHTRVTASEWMYRNIPNQSIMINELWDDPLPLQLPNQYGKTLTGEMIPVFEIESTQKWDTIHSVLQKADYYVLSSNRAWGSIGTVPDLYPQTTQFYDELFAEKMNYQKVADFTSYPSLKYLGIPLVFPDDWADETFTVYDHPRVMIFKHDTKN